MDQVLEQRPAPEAIPAIEATLNYFVNDGTKIFTEAAGAGERDKRSGKMAAGNLSAAGTAAIGAAAAVPVITKTTTAATVPTPALQRSTADATRGPSRKRSRSVAPGRREGGAS